MGSNGFILLSPSAKAQAAPHSRQEPLKPIISPAAALGAQDHSSTHLESSWNESSSAPLEAEGHPARICSGSLSAQGRTARDARHTAHLSGVGVPHDVHEGFPTSPQSSVSSSTPIEEDQESSWGLNAVDRQASGSRLLGRDDEQGRRGGELAEQNPDQLGAQRDSGLAEQRPTTPAPLQNSGLAEHHDNGLHGHRGAGLLGQQGGGLVAHRTNEVAPLYHDGAAVQNEEADGRGGLFQRLLHSTQPAVKESPHRHGVAHMPQEPREAGAGSGDGLIFVSIAAYRDPETQWTLADLFAKVRLGFFLVSTFIPQSSESCIGEYHRRKLWSSDASTCHTTPTRSCSGADACEQQRDRCTVDVATRE